MALRLHVWWGTERARQIKVTGSHSYQWWKIRLPEKVAYRKMKILIPREGILLQNSFTVKN